MIDIHRLPERYRLILCDIWGVVHDGVHLYPGAADRLLQWRSQGRTIILVTNAPRTAEAVEEQLHRLGLPADSWNGIATSGEAGIAEILSGGRVVGFIGTASDRAILEGRGVQIAHDGFTELACTGLDDKRRQVEEYREQLESLAERDVRMHCLNPDRVVVRGGAAEPCAGALADIYLGLGGRVTWYGKPFPAIYHYALGLAGSPPASDVLAIGDGLPTDIVGAAKQGFEAIFVAGGIHAGEPFPEDFAEQNGLGNWRPFAVVETIG